MGKVKGTGSQKPKGDKKDKEMKKPSKVAQTRAELTKQVENIDANIDALKKLGLIGSGAFDQKPIDKTNMTKRQKKRAQMKKKRARGTPKL